MKRIEEIQQKATEAGDARFRRSERERMAYVLGWIHGGQWADYTMLDKVCEWLKEHMYFTEGIANGEAYYQCNSMESFLNDLKRAMKE